jgi:hypothetical protein
MATAQQAGLSADELATIRVFQANTPSVVNITNVREARSYYSMDVEKIPAGSGSGFIWDTQGALPCVVDVALPLWACLCV